MTSIGHYPFEKKTLNESKFMISNKKNSPDRTSNKIQTIDIDMCKMLQVIGMCNILRSVRTFIPKIYVLIRMAGIFKIYALSVLRIFTVMCVLLLYLNICFERACAEVKRRHIYIILFFTLTARVAVADVSNTLTNTRHYSPDYKVHSSQLTDYSDNTTVIPTKGTTSLLIEQTLDSNWTQQIKVEEKTSDNIHSKQKGSSKQKTNVEPMTALLFDKENVHTTEQPIFTTSLQTSYTMEYSDSILINNHNRHSYFSYTPTLSYDSLLSSLQQDISAVDPTYSSFDLNSRQIQESMKLPMQKELITKYSTDSPNSVESKDLINNNEFDSFQRITPITETKDVLNPTPVPLKHSMRVSQYSVVLQINSTLSQIEIEQENTAIPYSSTYSNEYRPVSIKNMETINVSNTETKTTSNYGIFSEKTLETEISTVNSEASLILGKQKTREKESPFLENTASNFSMTVNNVDIQDFENSSFLSQTKNIIDFLNSSLSYITEKQIETSGMEQLEGATLTIKSSKIYLLVSEHGNSKISIPVIPSPIFMTDHSVIKRNSRSFQTEHSKEIPTETQSSLKINQFSLTPTRISSIEGTQTRDVLLDTPRTTLHYLQYGFLTALNPKDEIGRITKTQNEETKHIYTSSITSSSILPDVYHIDSTRQITDDNLKIGFELEASFTTIPTSPSTTKPNIDESLTEHDNTMIQSIVENTIVIQNYTKLTIQCDKCKTSENTPNDSSLYDYEDSSSLVSSTIIWDDIILESTETYANHNALESSLLKQNTSIQRSQTLSMPIQYSLSRTINDNGFLYTSFVNSPSQRSADIFQDTTQNSNFQDFKYLQLPSLTLSQVQPVNTDLSTSIKNELSSPLNLMSYDQLSEIYTDISYSRIPILLNENTENNVNNIASTSIGNATDLIENLNASSANNTNKEYLYKLIESKVEKVSLSLSERKISNNTYATDTPTSTVKGMTTIQSSSAVAFNPPLLNETLFTKSRDTVDENKDDYARRNDLSSSFTTLRDFLSFKFETPYFSKSSSEKQNIEISPSMTGSKVPSSYNTLYYDTDHIGSTVSYNRENHITMINEDSIHSNIDPSTFKHLKFDLDPTSTMIMGDKHTDEIKLTKVVAQPFESDFKLFINDPLNDIKTLYKTSSDMSVSTHNSDMNSFDSTAFSSNSKPYVVGSITSGVDRNTVVTRAFSDNSGYLLRPSQTISMKTSPLIDLTSNVLSKQSTPTHVSNSLISTTDTFLTSMVSTPLESKEEIASEHSSLSHLSQPFQSDIVKTNRLDQKIDYQSISFIKSRDLHEHSFTKELSLNGDIEDNSDSGSMIVPVKSKSNGVYKPSKYLSMDKHFYSSKNVQKMYHTEVNQDNLLSINSKEVYLQTSAPSQILTDSSSVIYHDNIDNGNTKRSSVIEPAIRDVSVLRILPSASLSLDKVFEMSTGLTFILDHTPSKYTPEVVRVASKIMLETSRETLSTMIQDMKSLGSSDNIDYEYFHFIKTTDKQSTQNIDTSSDVLYSSSVDLDQMGNFSSTFSSYIDLSTTSKVISSSNCSNTIHSESKRDFGLSLSSTGPYVLDHTSSKYTHEVVRVHSKFMQEASRETLSAMIPDVKSLGSSVNIDYEYFHLIKTSDKQSTPKLDTSSDFLYSSSIDFDQIGQFSSTFSSYIDLTTTSKIVFSTDLSHAFHSESNHASDLSSSLAGLNEFSSLGSTVELSTMQNDKFIYTDVIDSFYKSSYISQSPLTTLLKSDLAAIKQDTSKVSISPRISHTKMALNTTRQSLTLEKSNTKEITNTTSSLLPSISSLSTSLEKVSYTISVPELLYQDSRIVTKSKDTNASIKRSELSSMVSQIEETSHDTYVNTVVEFSNFEQGIINSLSIEHTEMLLDSIRQSMTLPSTRVSSKIIENTETTASMLPTITPTSAKLEHISNTLSDTASLYQHSRIAIELENDYIVKNSDKLSSSVSQKATSSVKVFDTTSDLSVTGHVSLVAGIQTPSAVTVNYTFPKPTTASTNNTLVEISTLVSSSPESLYKTKLQSSFSVSLQPSERVPLSLLKSESSNPMSTSVPSLTSVQMSEKLIFQTTLVNTLYSMSEPTYFTTISTQQLDRGKYLETESRIDSTKNSDTRVEVISDVPYVSQHFTTREYLTSSISSSSRPTVISAFEINYLSIGVQIKQSVEIGEASFIQTMQKGLLKCFLEGLSKLQNKTRHRRHSIRKRSRHSSNMVKVVNVQRSLYNSVQVDVTFYVTREAKPLPGRSAQVVFDSLTLVESSALIGYPVSSKVVVLSATSTVAPEAPAAPKKATSPVIIVLILIPLLLIILAASILLYLYWYEPRKKGTRTKTPWQLPTFPSMRKQKLDDFDLMIDMENGKVVSRLSTKIYADNKLCIETCAESPPNQHIPPKEILALERAFSKANMLSQLEHRHGFHETTLTTKPSKDSGGPCDTSILMVKANIHINEQNEQNVTIAKNSTRKSGKLNSTMPAKFSNDINENRLYDGRSLPSPDVIPDNDNMLYKHRSTIKHDSGYDRTSMHVHEKRMLPVLTKNHSYEDISEPSMTEYEASDNESFDSKEAYFSGEDDSMDIDFSVCNSGNDIKNKVVNRTKREMQCTDSVEDILRQLRERSPLCRVSSGTFKAKKIQKRKPLRDSFIECVDTTVYLEGLPNPRHSSLEITDNMIYPGSQAPKLPVEGYCNKVLQKPFYSSLTLSKPPRIVNNFIEGDLEDDVFLPAEKDLKSSNQNRKRLIPTKPSMLKNDSANPGKMKKLQMKESDLPDYCTPWDIFGNKVQQLLQRSDIPCVDGSAYAGDEFETVNFTTNPNTFHHLPSSHHTSDSTKYSQQGKKQTAKMNADMVTSSPGMFEHVTKMSRIGNRQVSANLNTDFGPQFRALPFQAIRPSTRPSTRTASPVESFKALPDHITQLLREQELRYENESIDDPRVIVESPDGLVAEKTIDEVTTEPVEPLRTQRFSVSLNSRSDQQESAPRQTYADHRSHDRTPSRPYEEIKLGRNMRAAPRGSLGRLGVSRTNQAEDNWSRSTNRSQDLSQSFRTLSTHEANQTIKTEDPLEKAEERQRHLEEELQKLKETETRKKLDLVMPTRDVYVEVHEKPKSLNSSDDEAGKRSNRDPKTKDTISDELFPLENKTGEITPAPPAPEDLYSFTPKTQSGNDDQKLSPKLSSGYINHSYSPGRFSENNEQYNTSKRSVENLDAVSTQPFSFHDSGRDDKETAEAASSSYVAVKSDTGIIGAGDSRSESKQETADDIDDIEEDIEVENDSEKDKANSSDDEFNF